MSNLPQSYGSIAISYVWERAAAHPLYAAATLVVVLMGILVVVLATRKIIVIYRDPEPQEDEYERRLRILDENGREMPEGPLADAIRHSWETGEAVVWNEGDPPPGRRG